MEIRDTGTVLLSPSKETKEPSLCLYMSYIQSGDWKQQIQQNVKYAIIEIHFKHDITENCEKFLQSVQDLFGPHGVKIKAVIA